MGGRGAPRPGPGRDCELSRLLATFPLPLSVKTLPRPLLPRTLRGSKCSLRLSLVQSEASRRPRHTNRRHVLRLLPPFTLASCKSLESPEVAGAVARASHFPPLTLPLVRSSLPALVTPPPPGAATMALPWRRSCSKPLAAREVGSLLRGLGTGPCACALQGRP